MTYEEKVQKGKDGESALNEWFKVNNLPYVHINQSPETFSKLFTSNVKRPDFLLLLQSIGIIAVDAKNCELKDGCFTICYKTELKRMLSFERLFKIAVWYAYMGEQGEWYWISSLKAFEVGSKEGKDGQYIAIPKGEFAVLREASDLSLLYCQSLPNVSGTGDN